MMINLQTGITVIGFAITIASFFISRAKDIEEKAKENVKINFKLDEQCRSVSEIKDGVRESNTTLKRITETQIGHDKDIKNLFHQLEKIDKRVSSLERSAVDDGR